MNCCICYGNEEEYIQICKCRDSKFCFRCLAKWKLNQDTERNYIKNFEDWWKELNCPICKKKLDYEKTVFGEDWPRWAKFMEYMREDMDGCTMEEAIRREHSSDLLKTIIRLKDQNAHLQLQVEEDRNNMRELEKERKYERRQKEKEEKKAHELNNKLIELQERNKKLEKKNKEKGELLRKSRRKVLKLMTSLENGRKILEHESEFDLSLGFQTPTLSELFSQERMETL